VNNTLPLYLSVDVWPTNYAMRSEQWATVTVNGVSLMDYCRPDLSCGESWHTCIENINIAGLISEQNGGHIIVEVSSTGVNTGPCDKEGFPLYTRMFLQEALPYHEKLSVWVIIGAILGSLAILIVTLWLLFVNLIRRRGATVYSADVVTVEAKLDVESCMENEDNNDDNLFAVVEPSLVSKLKVERNMAQNLSKIVPIVETDLEMQDVEDTGEKVPLTVGRPPPKGPRPDAYTE
jgi:hypothetical protein